MPGFIQSQVGGLTSSPAQFAAAPNARVAEVLSMFAIEFLGLDESATPQEILDAVNEFGAKRLHNYIRNVYRNRKKEEAVSAVEQTNILDDEA